MANENCLFKKSCRVSDGVSPSASSTILTHTEWRSERHLFKVLCIIKSFNLQQNSAQIVGKRCSVHRL